MDAGTPLAEDAAVAGMDSGAGIVYAARAFGIKKRNKRGRNPARVPVILISAKAPLSKSCRFTAKCRSERSEESIFMPFGQAKKS
jgi:hypothetical protein